MANAKRAGKSENRLRRFWESKLTDHCIALAWSAQGQLLAAAAVSGPVTIYDVTNGAIKQVLSGHGFGTTAIDWHPSLELLATVGQDGQARIWNARTGVQQKTFEGGSAWVERVAWNAKGTILATAAGKKVRLWSEAGLLLREYADHRATVSDIAWQPATALLAVSSYGGVRLYDPNETASVRTMDWKGSPLALAWSPDGKVLAHGNQDATVHFWHMDRKEPLQMSGFPTKVRELSWDTTSRYLATGGSAAVCLWDCSGKGPEGTKPQMLLEDDDEDPLTSIHWQRRGFLLASAGQDGKVRLWQPANKKAPLVGEDRFRNGDASALAWSLDDKLLAAGAGDGSIAVFKVV